MMIDGIGKLALYVYQKDMTLLRMAVWMFLLAHVLSFVKLVWGMSNRMSGRFFECDGLEGWVFWSVCID